MNDKDEDQGGCGHGAGEEGQAEGYGCGDENQHATGDFDRAGEVTEPLSDADLIEEFHPGVAEFIQSNGEEKDSYGAAGHPFTERMARLALARLLKHE